MSLVVVERSFETPERFDELQAREAAVASCLEEYRVRFMRTYFSLDGLRAVCLFDGPDAESVRRTQRVANVPLERAYRAEAVAEAEPPPGGSAEHLVIQMQHADPISVAELGSLWRDRLARADGAGARLQGAYLARGGRRSFSVIGAPTAEALRATEVLRSLPRESAWPAKLHLSTSA